MQQRVFFKCVEGTTKDVVMDMLLEADVCWPWRKRREYLCVIEDFWVLCYCFMMCVGVLSCSVAGGLCLWKLWQVFVCLSCQVEVLVLRVLAMSGCLTLPIRDSSPRFPCFTSTSPKRLLL